MSQIGPKVDHRRKKLDKQRALATARHPLESKFGGLLLRTGGQETRMLSNEMGKLEREHKRQQMHIDQAKKQFLQQHNLPEPTLIVIRPPSPQLIRKTLYRNSDSADSLRGRNKSEPGYMKAIDSKTHTPLLRTTIDVFALKVKKKRNIWEDALHERPCFQSRIQPSWPLTAHEQEELRRGWELHIKAKTGHSPVSGRPKASRRQKSNPKTRKFRAVPPSTTDIPASVPIMQSNGANAFLTELPGVPRPQSANSASSRDLNVTFSENPSIIKTSSASEISLPRISAGNRRDTSSSPASTARGSITSGNSIENNACQVAGVSSGGSRPDSLPHSVVRRSSPDRGERKAPHHNMEAIREIMQY